MVVNTSWPKIEVSEVEGVNEIIVDYGEYHGDYAFSFSVDGEGEFKWSLYDPEYLEWGGRDITKEDMIKIRDWFIEHVKD